VVEAIELDAGSDTEPETDIVRRRDVIRGEVELSVRQNRLTLEVRNVTPIRDPNMPRDELLMHTMLSTHAILTIENGAFISITESESCGNEGAWPILVGEPGQVDTILVSPIILNDYPEIAPESPGDFFDGTEMDEMLTLRILTLTDAEKAEMLSVDECSRALLERTERLGGEHLMNLHGRLRRHGPRENES